MTVFSALNRKRFLIKLRLIHILLEKLNYIQKKDKYCSVCKAEMEAKKDEYDEDELELCPICKTNYIQPDDIMCVSCLKEHKGEEGELSGEWEDFMVSSDDDDDSDSMYDELGEMASVNDLTKAGMLDDDDDEMGGCVFTAGAVLLCLFECGVVVFGASYD